MRQNRPFYKTTHHNMTKIGPSVRLSDHKLVRNTQFYRTAHPKKGWWKIDEEPGRGVQNFLVAKVWTSRLKNRKKTPFPPFHASKSPYPQKKSMPHFSALKEVPTPLNLNGNLNHRSFLFPKKSFPLFQKPKRSKCFPFSEAEKSVCPLFQNQKSTCFSLLKLSPGT